MWRTARKSSIFPLDLDSPNGSDRRSRCTEESNRGKPTVTHTSHCSQSDEASSPGPPEAWNSTVAHSLPQRHPLVAVAAGLRVAVLLVGSFLMLR